MCLSYVHREMFFKSVLLYLLFSSVAAKALNSCPAGSTWVAPHPRSAYTRLDGVSFSAAYVTGHCRIKSKAYEYWAEKLANGRIEGWPHKSEGFKDWRKSEIEIAVEAFEKVPEFLWNPVKVFRADRSATKSNYATRAPQFVVLYDSALAKPSNLPRYMTHELAHEFFENMPRADRTAYRMVSGWTGPEDGVVKKPSNRSFVAPDGDLSPEEDFANNIEYLLFEPLRLKLKSPAIYDWLVINYGGKLKK